MRHAIIALLIAAACTTTCVHDLPDYTDSGVGCVLDCLEPAR